MSAIPLSDGLHHPHPHFSVGGRHLDTGGFSPTRHGGALRMLHCTAAAAAPAAMPCAISLLLLSLAAR
jgi:hypothetical protein